MLLTIRFIILPFRGIYCLENKSPSLILYIYIISRLYVKVKNYFTLFSLLFHSPRLAITKREVGVYLQRHSDSTWHGLPSHLADADIIIGQSNIFS
jgi:hypothetical protein